MRALQCLVVRNNIIRDKISDTLSQTRTERSNGLPQSHRRHIKHSNLEAETLVSSKCAIRHVLQLIHEPKRPCVECNYGKSREPRHNMIERCTSRMRIVLGDHSPCVCVCAHTHNPLTPIGSCACVSSGESATAFFFDSSTVRLFLRLKSHEPVIATDPPVAPTRFNDKLFTFFRRVCSHSGSVRACARTRQQIIHMINTSIN